MATQAPARAEIHSMLADELARRIVDRDFELYLVVDSVACAPTPIEIDEIVIAVERWLRSLDPDRRSGDPSITLDIGGVRIALRAHGKPELTRGRGRLMANRAAGFPHGCR
jgi:hypothetical protein